MSDISDLKRAHGKLTETLAQLARSNKELESFAYAASHDLRGPLITITGFLGRLALDTEQGDAGRMHSDLARIGEATMKMDRLLHDLLELSRIGRVVGSLEDVPLTGLAREVADLLAGPIVERGVRVEISPDLPTVYGERARLTQLLMNLLDNAVKFMGEQPDPQVKIGVRRDGEETVCYVRDNGIGIDPQHKDRIFGLFQQLDPSRGGTGIGLSVAKRVVETHGGRIWLESDGPGKGSTFCFTLLRKAEPVTEEERENERFLPKTLARVAG
jgi:signal transduction histidine kinase